MFPPWLTAKIACSMSELLLEEDEDRMQALEWHRAEYGLQDETLEERYEMLRGAYDRLTDCTRSIGAERDRLLRAIEEFVRNYQRIQAESAEFVREYQQLKKETEKMVRDVQTKLKAYDLMKRLLTQLLTNADRYFTPEVTGEHRRKMANFLAKLPI